MGAASGSIAEHRPGAQQASVFCRTCYHLATPAIARLARREAIYRQEKFSDHAPITVEYELKV
jgi:exodeoxyribonuclease-3